MEIVCSFLCGKLSTRYNMSFNFQDSASLSDLNLQDGHYFMLNRKPSSKSSVPVTASRAPQRQSSAGQHTVAIPMSGTECVVSTTIVLICYSYRQWYRRFHREKEHSTKTCLFSMHVDVQTVCGTVCQERGASIHYVMPAGDRGVIAWCYVTRSTFRGHVLDNRQRVSKIRYFCVSTHD